jgi:hypothetical protein
MEYILQQYGALGIARDDKDRVAKRVELVASQGHENDFLRGRWTPRAVSIEAGMKRLCHPGLNHLHEKDISCVRESTMDMGEEAINDLPSENPT